MLPTFNTKPTGYSLIEVVVYTALVVVVGGVTAALTMQMVQSVGRSRASLTALDNARRAMDVMTREVSYADSIYEPTTDSSSQLSVQTKHGLNEGDPWPYTYVDYFVVDGKLYEKRESGISQITSDNVVVDNFTITSLNNNSAVNIILTVHYLTTRSDLQQQSTVTLHSLIALRSYE